MFHREKISVDINIRKAPGFLFKVQCGSMGNYFGYAKENYS
jgi:hypothetical protein